MRNIDSDMHTDPWLRTLTMTQRVAWYGMITQIADDQGRFRRDYVDFRYKIFFGDQIPDSEIGAILENFSKAGKIVVYRDSNPNNLDEYIQIINWWKYQGSASYMTQSKYPAPPGWTDKWCYTGKKRKPVKSDNWDSGICGFIPVQMPIITPVVSPVVTPVKGGVV